MNQPKLSVVVITLNEEDSIQQCLESVKDLADEIIVVDSGSTDHTIEIAKKFGAKVYHRGFDNYAAQKNYAAEKATSDWILSLDADEAVSPELAGEIKQLISSSVSQLNSSPVGFLIPRRNFLLGAEIKHTRWAPDKHIWLWRRRVGKWVGKIHEEVVVEGVVGELKHAKIHYSYKTVSEFLEMVNRYTEREAISMHERGVKFSFVNLILEPTKSFVGRFAYKAGFLDGWRGFVLSFLRAYYKFILWAKLWNLK